MKIMGLRELCREAKGLESLGVGIGGRLAIGLQVANHRLRCPLICCPDPASKGQHIRAKVVDPLYMAQRSITWSGKSSHVDI
ncbi:hypothetical protein [Thioalkalivibrio sp. XN279]|uniref:hypothetical protein n=1 Tax=Thioalkalivibrio sp. XN279 TaxID=2714953 RepID=UPI00140E4AD1|nr:hypothetical protein [Thioalkalivibrio sp. XN279]NHA14015.1 hypothetical protein [Thioalkalivibrio sp. XN279]